MCGAKAVFADIDPETGCLDPRKIEEKITDKTKALIFVYWGGNIPSGGSDDPFTCSIIETNAICKKHNISFIEDAAHALGSKFMLRGYRAVTVGGDSVIGVNGKYMPDFTCFSLQAIKFVTSGDGGILCVHNDEMVNRVKRMKWFGLDKNAPRRPEGDRSCLINELGFKYNMNDLTAAVALGNFSDVTDRITTRYTHTSFYDKNLIDIPGVTLLKRSRLSKPCNWVYTIKVNDRINFINKMKSCGIPVSVLDRRIDEHPIFGGLTEGLTGQEEFDKSQISIPVHEALTQEDLDLIVKSIKEGW
jgi:perosamine synthetase